MTKLRKLLKDDRYPQYNVHEGYRLVTPISDVERRILADCKDDKVASSASFQEASIFGTLCVALGALCVCAVNLSQCVELFYFVYRSYNNSHE